MCIIKFSDNLVEFCPLVFELDMIVSSSLNRGYKNALQTIPFLHDIAQLRHRVVLYASARHIPTYVVRTRRDAAKLIFIYTAVGHM